MTKETVIAILSELKKCYLNGVVNVLDSAIEAVEMQESGKVNITITQSDGWKEGNCPFCGMKVDSFYNWSFCGTCGKGLKWE